MYNLKLKNVATVPHGMNLPGSHQIPTNHSSMPSQQQQPQPQSSNSSQPQNIPGSTQNVMLNSLPSNSDSQSVALSGQPISQNQQQSTSSPTYYGDQTPSQPTQINSGPVGEPQLSGAIATSPLSPHLQQNGYPVSGNGATGAGNVTGNGQLQNYTQQRQQQQQQPPNNGGQGTWTGQNTLSYTQSIQPPDLRASHNTYCKWSSIRY